MSDVRIWQREKYHSSLQHKLKRKMANAIRKALANSAFFSTLGYLPYDIEELREHLEEEYVREYDSAVDWELVGSKYDIDHRIPDSWFSYESPDDDEFILAWGMDNLRLMDRIKNREKKNKLANPTKKQEEDDGYRKVLERNGYYKK